jgi:hypothetical protein
MEPACTVLEVDRRLGAQEPLLGDGCHHARRRVHVGDPGPADDHSGEA